MRAIAANAPKSAWLASEREMRDLWQKRVKNDWLGLKLAGKGRCDIREILGKRHTTPFKRIAKTQSEDAFESFMNAFHGHRTAYQLHGIADRRGLRYLYAALACRYRRHSGREGRMRHHPRTRAR